MRAVRAIVPSPDELLGRPVHLGEVRPIRHPVRDAGFALTEVVEATEVHQGLEGQHHGPAVGLLVDDGQEPDADDAQRMRSVRSGHDQLVTDVEVERVPHGRPDQDLVRAARCLAAEQGRLDPSADGLDPDRRDLVASGLHRESERTLADPCRGGDAVVIGQLSSVDEIDLLGWPRVGGEAVPGTPCRRRRRQRVADARGQEQRHRHEGGGHRRRADREDDRRPPPLRPALEREPGSGGGHGLQAQPARQRQGGGRAAARAGRTIDR